MKSLDEYLRDAEQAHGHLCAGQVLGVRMAMLGLVKLGIDDPRGKDPKRLVTFVEIDLFATQWVKVKLPPEEFPGYKGDRAVCEICGEGINFRREVLRQGRVLCHACACTEDRYYEPL